MKDDFLTIPDAPNYEINSELIVRNKKTGRLLKLKKSHSGTSTFYDLKYHAVRIRRVATTLRNQAVAFAFDSKFEPVPSLQYRYEFNLKTNQLRNAFTKKILKPSLGRFKINMNGRGNKAENRSITSLRWEVGGIIPPFGSKVNKPCILSKGNQIFHFDTHLAAAKFLAEKIFYSVKWIRLRFDKRKEFIGDWHVNYLEDEKTGCGDARAGAYYGQGRRGGGCHV